MHYFSRSNPPHLPLFMTLCVIILFVNTPAFAQFGSLAGKPWLALLLKCSWHFDYVKACSFKKHEYNAEREDFNH